MHKSIITNLDIKTCYLCGERGLMEAHHCIHGTANRRLADKDGLIVNLCPECHRKLHDKGVMDDHLKAIAENAWLRYNRATVEEFIARYGRSYI